MKSKASIKGHPLHPILVGFPIAFFTGTVFFDIAGLITKNTNYHQIGGYLEIAGIIMGLLAAVPGLIDYFYTVPPVSSAKKRATLHGVINVLMVLSFAIAYVCRNKSDAFFILALELAGFILMCISGWLGGTLVYRNQIGVDPRYAGAGKWKEVYLEAREGVIEVATMDELQTDQMKLLHIAGKRMVLANTTEGYVAFDDRCTHKGGSLAGGMMICGTVQCPWHGSQFDGKTGQVKCRPATVNITTYLITVKDGKIYLSL
jgi:uncharacterized membrane protein/nitrite reductase/ring-hydroxylating ferredoxin subunit